MTDRVTQFPKETGVRGEFVRQESAFRSWVRRDPDAEYPAESGRYHLYVSYACPWAHRTIIFRKLQRLEHAISMTVVDPVRDERGWAFTEDSGPDPINGFDFLAEAYEATDPTFDGRVTVPVLWDKKTGRIVNNESSEIIRMLDREFDEWGDPEIDFYPESLRSEIDSINRTVYDNVNNGVYRCGFAGSQEAYDEAYHSLFDTLERLEQRLGEQRYLAGDRLTEADWRLFTTMIRFDPVYFGHFKCNRKRLIDYPNLWGWTRELYQYRDVASTVRLDHIKRHYYITHNRLNPSGIVPNGPDIDYDEPHGREASG